MGKCTKQFDTALREINKVRQRDYGDPAEQFDKIAVLQLVVRTCPDVRIRHAMEMICVKMIRLTQNPDHMDSIIDIAGYARTMAMILDKVEVDE